jgi:hypothetical protein
MYRLKGGTGAAKQRKIFSPGRERLCQKAASTKNFSERVTNKEGRVKPSEKIGVEAID